MADLVQCSRKRHERGKMAYAGLQGEEDARRVEHSLRDLITIY
jgi:hypothetical protein